MPNRKKKEEAVVETTTEEVTSKAPKARWTAFLERYQEQNPVKYAQKKARGEFDKVPESFVG